MLRWSSHWSSSLRGFFTAWPRPATASVAPAGAPTGTDRAQTTATGFWNASPWGQWPQLLIFLRLWPCAADQRAMES
uniref:Putative secreted protein n=1 Tax=Ixodes ricinus TaxID=34613 RepID=A0A6B0U5U9_IXORI